MPDSYDQWNHESYQDEGGSGLLWRTARNVAVLLAGSLLLLGGMKWGGEQVAKPRTETGTEHALAQSQNPGPAPAPTDGAPPTAAGRGR